MSNQKEENIKIFFCPSCKSMNVKFVFGFANAFGIIPKQKCFDCELEMHGFPILQVSRKDLEKKPKSSKKIKIRGKLSRR